MAGPYQDDADESGDAADPVSPDPEAPTTEDDVAVPVEAPAGKHQHRPYSEAVAPDEVERLVVAGHAEVMHDGVVVITAPARIIPQH